MAASLADLHPEKAIDRKVGAATDRHRRKANRENPDRVPEPDAQE